MAKCKRLPEGKPPFPYGFPMVSLWFSYGFPMVSLWFPYGFPMVSLWFPYGFPGVSPELPAGGPELQEARKQLPVLNEYGDRIPTGEAGAVGAGFYGFIMV